MINARGHDRPVSPSVLWGRPRIEGSTTTYRIALSVANDDVDNIGVRVIIAEQASVLHTDNANAGRSAAPDTGSQAKLSFRER